MIYICEFGWWGEDRDIILVTEDITEAIYVCLQHGDKDGDFETITIQVWHGKERIVEYGPVDSLIRDYQPDPVDVLKQLQTEISLALTERNCEEEFSL